jgi:hypothetical protein
LLRSTTLISIILLALAIPQDDLKIVREFPGACATILP